MLVSQSGILTLLPTFWKISCNNSVIGWEAGKTNLTKAALKSSTLEVKAKNVGYFILLHADYHFFSELDILYFHFFPPFTCLY